MAGLFALKPGEVFAGAYEIVRPLSEGGMGAVYVAKQLSTDKLRALKIMQPGLVGSPRLRERFAQEAKLGGLADSEHVVEAIDSGIETERGIPWLAMELLVGETLGARLAKSGAMPTGAVHAIFRELCDGLGRAHAAGIVHRDLKPENVFLAKDRAGETVKILDFGIAKLAVEARTHSSLILGTPLYMPPEQMIPGCAVTAATDVWPLGLIAFQCLTGRVYWRAASEEGATPLMLLNEAAYLPMPLASERARDLGVEIALPFGFDAWFQRCTDRDAKLRPKDATAAWAELEPLLTGASGSVVVRPISTDPGVAPADVSTDVFLAQRASIERSEGDLPQAATVPVSSAGGRDAGAPASAPTQPSPAAGRSGAAPGEPPVAPAPPAGTPRRRWPAYAAAAAISTSLVGWLALSDGPTAQPELARVDSAPAPSGDGLLLATSASALGPGSKTPPEAPEGTSSLADAAAVGTYGEAPKSSTVATRRSNTRATPAAPPKTTSTAQPTPASKKTKKEPTKPSPQQQAPMQKSMDEPAPLPPSFGNAPDAAPSGERAPSPRK